MIGQRDDWKVAVSDRKCIEVEDVCSCARAYDSMLQNRHAAMLDFAASLLLKCSSRAGKTIMEFPPQHAHLEYFIFEFNY